MSDLIRQRKIIEKTINKVTKRIEEKTWKFELKTCHDLGDVEEVFTTEGIATSESGDYKVVLRLKSFKSSYDFPSVLHKWHFSSNLKKSNPEEPFMFEGSFYKEMQSPEELEEKEMFDFINGLIEQLQEIRTDLDLQDI